MLVAMIRAAIVFVAVAVSMGAYTGSAWSLEWASPDSDRAISLYLRRSDFVPAQDRIESPHLTSPRLAWPPDRGANFSRATATHRKPVSDLEVADLPTLLAVDALETSVVFQEADFAESGVAFVGRYQGGILKSYHRTLSCEPLRGVVHSLPVRVAGKYLEKCARCFHAATAWAQDPPRVQVEGVRQDDPERRRRVAEQAAVLRRQAAVQQLRVALAGSKVIAKVDADPDMPRGVIVVVTNAWHYQPYQVRLQDAQLIQRLWTSYVAPGHPVTAAVEIRDLMGNEVGGSGLFSGASVWVSKP